MEYRQECQAGTPLADFPTWGATLLSPMLTLLNFSGRERGSELPPWVAVDRTTLSLERSLTSIRFNSADSPEDATDCRTCVTTILTRGNPQACVPSVSYFSRETSMSR